ncbi:MAG: SAM-dependent DNA methyltransferase [Lentisphaerae bacterium]|nr:SAM-dependent DNA methyltransferase [Lentisphaerota bacterium]
MPANNAQFSEITSFIWGIANDVLRDIYVRGKYRDVILPMTVIRRLDAVLESTKEQVLNLNKKLDESGITSKDPALCNEAGNAFYNISPFTLRDLRSRARQQQLRSDFEAYLDGFSPNVQEILEKFKFRNQIPTMVEADILGSIIAKFTTPDVNLSPHPTYDHDGNLIKPGLDNHTMGTIFEELIRLFNEENNEEAGEHFTPRDVVTLMANLIFHPMADQIKDATYSVYDGACGTGGMLTVAEETLAKLAAEHGKDVSIHLFGQEIQPETYAISKADMLLKGEGDAADNIKYCSTLSSDAFPAMEFDFMLSNPPYGKSWTTDLERMGGRSGIMDPRFTASHKDEELSLLTRSSDGQLLFLVNKLAKMKHTTELGSRIVQVHNGSSLFTGDAGQGESNIRRWVIENDWLEAIIALPLNMFYNTGIATYIWVLSNRKSAQRQGKVQLIDASGIFTPLRKNLGDKNCHLTTEQIDQITRMFLDFKETENSKIFPNEAFGYWKIVVERPLRLEGIEPGKVYKASEIKELCKTHKCSPEGVPVVRNVRQVRQVGQDVEVEYEPDVALRDTEQIPLLEEGGIEGFFKREVLPYTPDAWIDHAKTAIGYEISFTRHFYNPAPMRTLEEIGTELLALQREGDGLLEELVGTISYKLNGEKK